MNIDFLIHNGHVVDPANGVDGIRSIGVQGQRIVDIEGKTVTATNTLDASGCYVFPGLVDYHTHLFFGGALSGCYPDFQVGTGVTSAVDAGSSGCGTYRAFHQAVIVQSRVRIKALLSCYTGGLLSGGFHENFDPALFNKPMIAQLAREFPDTVIGLKMRLSLSGQLTKDIKPLEAAVAMADEIGGLSVCVHVTNPPCAMTDIVSLLRPGDVFCHVFHGKGDILLDKNGKIPPAFLRARERGVIFDVANGRMNCSHKVCRAAIREGFLPDVISTDMGLDKLYLGNHVRSLPFVMAKFLSFGMSLPDVVRSVTETPARLMNMAGKIGTLAPDAFADVAVFRKTDRRTAYLDAENDVQIGEGFLVPQATIINGLLAYAQADFNLAAQS